MSYHFAIQSPSRLFALLLALLWGGLVVGGSTKMALCRAAPDIPAAVSVCHCAMCREMHHTGMKCCCCHTSGTASQKAMFCARCDGSQPHSAAAVVWGQIAVLPTAVFFLPLTFRTDRVSSPRFPAAFLRPAPIPRPPRLL